MLKFAFMKAFISLFIIAFSVLASYAQGIPQKIYETEKAFEKMVADKGINAAFIEYLSPDGVMFFPQAANGREVWKSRPASPASLTWNPIWIDVSANGAMAYSIGNSVYRPKGMDDTNAFYGHYISVWARQMNGEYRASLDTGINHPKPLITPAEWKSPVRSDEKNITGSFAGDTSAGFFETAEKVSLVKAYKSYLADDAFLMRDGKEPFRGKKAALDFIGTEKLKIKFARRKSFVEAADLAYVHNTYSVIDKAGKETEKGNFVQVWKLNKSKWRIVADVLIPIPTAPIDLKRDQVSLSC